MRGDRRGHSESERANLTSVAFATLKRMVKDDATIVATRTYPFPRKYVVKRAGHETGNVETTDSVVSDLVMTNCIAITKHDEQYNNLTYELTDYGREVFARKGRL